MADVYREEGLPRLKWQSDDYSDDVPFWTPYPGGAKEEGLLILPYSVRASNTLFPRTTRSNSLAVRQQRLQVLSR